ncbi:MAG: universal stress protein [Methanobacterium sp.]
MYENIVVALDGSTLSDLAMNASLDLAEVYNKNPLTCCHVYAANMHRTRFQDMEPGLPDKYQEEERLEYLRGAHEDIITDGMQLISDAYLAPIVKEAENRGIKYKGSTPEGRNYVELLKVIRNDKSDLVIMGAWGHGHVGDGSFGSMTERTLLYAPQSDVLVMKKPWNFKGRPIIVGIDGSENSFAALKKAVEISKIVNAPVEGVAVYDPFFHVDVFSTISKVLPEDAKERFNFEAQEQLHDEIIDKGLETLYREGVERGILMARSMGVELNPEIAKGKVYSQIHHHAALKSAGLIVIGRWGLHQEDESLIGSNSLKLARLSETNVLIVGQSNKYLKVPELPMQEERKSLEWTDEAEAMMDRVPPFAQKMAHKMVENRALEKNETVITLETVQEMAKLFGMGKKSKKKVNDNVPEAEIVVLRKKKRMAPNFHQHILKSKIQGQIINPGDKILVYEVLETVPPEKVRVTENTILEFR